jgi:HD superfamily phosphodiesterase
MHTKTAKKIAEERTQFMELFLNQLRNEILYKY